MSEDDGAAESRRSVAVVSAGLRDPSSSSLLADRLADATVAALRLRGLEPELRRVELREHAHDLTNALLSGFPAPALREVMETVASADALIAVSPVFSGSYNGLFKTFFDVMGADSLAEMPVLLGATAGTPRHSLAIEHALRPLLSYLRALTVPTGVFAATDDFGRSATARSDDAVAPLGERVQRGAKELADLMASRERRRPNDPFELTAGFEDLLAEGSQGDSFAR